MHEMAEDRISQGQRLAFARRQAGYETATEAADALKMHRPTYLAHENGTRGYARSAACYSAFYRVNLRWLWEGAGPIKPGGRSPIEDAFERIPPDRREEALNYLDYLASRKN